MFTLPLQEGSGELITAHNAPILKVKFLYKHLLDNRQIVDVEGFNPNVLHIFQRSASHASEWGAGLGNLVPVAVVNLIRSAICLAIRRNRWSLIINSYP